MMLRIYRITSVVLLALLALMPLIFRQHIIFATFATTVVTLVLIFIAFQVQRLLMLTRTIAKLDELLKLLRDTKRALSPVNRSRLCKNSQKCERDYCKTARLNVRAAEKMALQPNVPAAAPNITMMVSPMEQPG